ncbi:MAG: rhodanese-like domain-containing protein [Janthinobacterium lividum]
MNSPNPPTPSWIRPLALLALLRSDSEIALLDVREARAFVAGHLNLARMTPLSHLELNVRALVPRLGTTVVLVDAGATGGPVTRAAALLHRMGYGDVHVLAGGIDAWQSASLPVVDGYGTLLKAFGDRVRRHRAVPAVGGDALRSRLEAGEATTLIDARPADEYAYLALPGTANHAGTELALREWPVDAQSMPWVVNCFSRTRGIIGTATLHLLGHPDARFLEDGVMRWALDGAPVVENAQPTIDLPEASADELRRRADALIDRYALEVIDPRALQTLRSDADRTLYVFDLRPRPAADAAPPPGVRAVPGGQLLMHFEHLVGTRNARIVLLDDPHRLRAAITAFWLVQLDQAEVFILDGVLPEPWSSGTELEDAQHANDAASLTPGALAVLLDTECDRVHVVDVGPSEDFERHHLPGARYLLPYTLEPLATLDPAAHCLVFTSPDGRAARIAARDANERWPGCVARWLAGGTRAWRDAGFPTEQAWRADQLLTPFEDDWGSVMRVPADRRDSAWADYLQWERTLEARVATDPTVSFRLF